MIQIFQSNLAVVDLVKRPLERPKNVSLCPNFYRREGVRFQTKMSHFFSPKVPREGGCQARMEQCLIFLGFFLKASLSESYEEAERVLVNVTADQADVANVNAVSVNEVTNAVVAEN